MQIKCNRIFGLPIPIRSNTFDRIFLTNVRTSCQKMLAALKQWCLDLDTLHTGCITSMRWLYSQPGACSMYNRHYKLGCTTYTIGYIGVLVAV